MTLLSHSQARYLAESLWGPGGTTAYRTNRRGAFYFSCSGHGGYVIDDRALTADEKRKLTDAGFTADQCWGVRAANGDIVTVRHPNSQVRYPHRVTYRYLRGEYQDNDIPVWIFEEDCDWAAVQVFTDIRSAGFSAPDSEMTQLAVGSLKRWNPEAFRQVRS